MPLGNAIGQPVLINGVSYAHADINVTLLGSLIIGITGISYSDKQVIEGNFSTGVKATSVGFGPITNAASITLTLEACQALIDSAPGKRIQNIAFFDVGMNYTPDTGAFKRHALRKCRFKGVDLSSQVGNTQIEVTLELFVGDIDYNA